MYLRFILFLILVFWLAHQKAAIATPLHILLSMWKILFFTVYFVFSETIYQIHISMSLYDIVLKSNKLQNYEGEIRHVNAKKSYLHFYDFTAEPFFVF